MRSVLVTGAGRGVGLATARALAAHGLRVFLGIRDRAKAGQIATALRCSAGETIPLGLDVTDKESISAAVATIRAMGGLDILINNAAVMPESVDGGTRTIPPDDVTAEMLLNAFSTNFFGPVELIRQCLPMLRTGISPRIVNVSSRLGSFGLQTDPAWPHRQVNQLGYSSSKAALNMATVTLAYALRGTSIKVNAVTPGIVATDLNGAGANSLAGRPGYRTPEEGAALVIACALLPDDGPTGQFFGPDGIAPW